jgi:uncharacterized membrane protein YeaQ/YmgE (transglycosylase-associated protein family)
MTNVHSILRSLTIYAVCIPLAVFLGYVLSNPLDRGSFITVTVVLAVLCAPVLIRFHYPLMLLSWNMIAVLFFLPGQPQLFFATIAISFAISFTQRILNKELRPISVPALTWPIIAIAVVVAVTGALTGGFGVRAFGGQVYGGKRYFLIFLGILGFFALTAHRIPRERAGLYLALFFLGGLTYLIGDLFPVLFSPFPFLFYVFPPSSLTGDFEFGITRFGGLAQASAGVFAYMMARYGIRGILHAGKPWRLLAFVIFSGLSLFGGFRSVLIGIFGVFVLQFFLEGLHRTRLLPIMVLMVTMIGASVLPFTTKLPFTVQRALAFLPVVPVDPVVRLSAESSIDWRLNMWKALLPQVPQYLLLGKGLAMSQEDFGLSLESMSTDARALTEDQWGAALAGDYHNGPLSVVIPFGIWGVIAWVWFLAAGLRVLYLNYRYGDPALKSINTFLLATVMVRMLMFWFLVGGFYQDVIYYMGVIGLNVSLNGGVARRVTATALPESQATQLPTILRRQRPVFSR